MCLVGWDCPKSNERYTKCGGFDKLNHRNANLLDNPLSERRKYKKYDLVIKMPIKTEKFRFYRHFFCKNENYVLKLQMVWNGYVNYGKQDGGKAKETAPKWSGERPFMAASCGAKRSNERSGTTELRLAKETSPENILKRVLLFYLTF